MSCPSPSDSGWPATAAADDSRPPSLATAASRLPPGRRPSISTCKAREHRSHVHGTEPPSSPQPRAASISRRSALSCAGSISYTVLHLHYERTPVSFNSWRFLEQVDNSLLRSSSRAQSLARELYHQPGAFLTLLRKFSG